MSILHGTESSRTLRLDVTERRPPVLALAAPALYLLACCLAIRSVLVDRADFGIAGLLLAAGLLPAFAIPAVFSTRRARLELGGDGLTIDGRLEKVDDARIERGQRGAAILHLVTRSGRARAFIVASYKDAERMIAFLPPVSAPAGALAA